MPNSIKNLPTEIITKIFSYLDNDSQNSLVCTSKYFYKLFQKERIENALISSLLKNQHFTLNLYLKNHPELAILPFTFLDNEKCKWNTSLFQYALWSLNVSLCEMIVSNIPSNDAGEIMRITLQNQYISHFENDGIEFSDSNNQIIKAPSFDINLLIKLLKQYNSSLNGNQINLGILEAQIRAIKIPQYLNIEFSGNTKQPLMIHENRGEKPVDIAAIQKFNCDPNERMKSIFSYNVKAFITHFLRNKQLIKDFKQILFQAEEPVKNDNNCLIC